MFTIEIRWIQPIQSGFSASMVQYGENSSKGIVITPCAIEMGLADL